MDQPQEITEKSEETRMAETATAETKPEDKTVEINDTEVVAKTEVKEPTREELRAQGWTARDLEAAEKRGMISKPGEKKPEVKKEEEKADGKTGVAKEEVKPEIKPEVKRNVLPDFTMTPEQEKVFLDTFGVGTAPRAMYFRMKNERQTRQVSESRVRELEARLQALEKPPVQAKVEVDENGTAIDPETQPLTLKALKELRVQEAEALRKQQEENQGRVASVMSAQKEQEEYAKAIHEDFDQSLELAKDLMQNLETLIPEKWKQTKAIKMIRDFQIAAANSDKMGLDEYNAAMIAYEIGQMHPKYGQPADTTGKEQVKDPKANGGLTAEQMKRIEQNTQRRGSSAAIPAGGGKRVISVDDVDLKTLNAMSYSERQKFREKHPERYAALLRG